MERLRKILLNFYVDGSKTKEDYLPSFYRGASFVIENAADILEEIRNRNAICAIDKAGNVVHTFHSFNEIAQHFGVVRPDNVRNVLKGRQKSAYGFIWKYKRDL